MYTSNTVGSREEIPKVLYTIKNFQPSILSITQTEFDILIGSVLGDGYITKKGKIQIEQGDKQYEYVEWKYKMLENIVSGKILRTERRYHAYKNASVSYRFWTKRYFRIWRDIFYPNGSKIVPIILTQEHLTPLAVAIWYMDDGFLKNKNSIAISTDNFSKECLRILQNILKKRYNIMPNVVARNKLYFDREETNKLVQIIQPFIISSMRYKLP